MIRGLTLNFLSSNYCNTDYLLIPVDMFSHVIVCSLSNEQKSTSVRTSKLLCVNAIDFSPDGVYKSL